MGVVYLNLLKSFDSVSCKTLRQADETQVVQVYSEMD